MSGFKTKKMTVEEFQKIKDNPVQRNTEKHALAVSRPNGHLSEIAPTHQTVSIAQTKDGKQRWVLDGHSRRFLWKRGELEEPTSLTANIYTVKDKDEAISLYYMFDSSSATETAGDKMFGGFRFHKFKPKNNFLQLGGIHSAMQRLAFFPQYTDRRNLSINELIKPWIPALKIIDNSSHAIRFATLFPAWVCAAMLMTIHRDGAFAMSFWEAYATNEGSKEKATMDGIYAARLFWEHTKDQQKGHGNTLIKTCTPAMLEIYEQWKAGTRFPTKGSGILSYGLPRKADYPSVSEWWQANIGEFFYPQLRLKGIA